MHLFDLFDSHNLAKTGVWQKNVITMKLGVKNCVGIHDPMPKSSSEDTKTAIFHFFERGQGRALTLRPYI